MLLIKQNTRFLLHSKRCLSIPMFPSYSIQTKNFFHFSETPKSDQPDISPPLSPQKDPFPKEMTISEKLDIIFPSEELIPNKVFNNTKIFLNRRIDVPGFTSQKRYFAATIGFWIALGGILFAYAHPLAALIPSWFASGNMLSFYLSTSFARKLIYRIDLDHEAGNKIKLYSILRKKPFDVLVRDLKITEINKLAEKEEVYLFKFDAQDEFGKEIKNGKIFFPVNIFVENNALLKSILLGREEEVKSWKFEKKEEDLDNNQEKAANETNNKTE